MDSSPAADRRVPFASLSFYQDLIGDLRLSYCLASSPRVWVGAKLFMSVLMVGEKNSQTAWGGPAALPACVSGACGCICVSFPPRLHPRRCLRINEVRLSVCALDTIVSGFP